MKYILLLCALFIFCYLLAFVLAPKVEKPVSLARQYEKIKLYKVDSLYKVYDSLIDRFIELEGQSIDALPDKKILKNNLPELDSIVKRSIVISHMIDSIDK